MLRKNVVLLVLSVFFLRSLEFFVMCESQCRETSRCIGRPDRLKLMWTVDNLKKKYWFRRPTIQTTVKTLIVNNNKGMERRFSKQ